MSTSIAPRAVVAAFDEWDRGAASFESLLASIEAPPLSRLVMPSLALGAANAVFAKGVAASAGVGTGVLCSDLAEAHERAREGRGVILLRTDLTREDAASLSMLSGVILTHAGLTSHGAILCRGAGVPCVLGGKNLEEAAKETDGVVTIDGASGQIVLGDARRTTAAAPSVERALAEARRLVTFRVECYAATRDEVRRSVAGGATRVGLVRMEHALARHGFSDVLTPLLANVSASKDALVRFEEAVSASLDAIATGHEPPIAVRLLDLQDGSRGALLENAHPGVTAAHRRASAKSAANVAGWIAPFVRSHDELERLHTELGEGLLGAMLETPDACDDVAQIATLSQRLVIGLGDLISARKHVTRNALHASHFDENERRFVAAVVTRAKEASPTVEIAVAGLDALSPALIEHAGELGADACIVAPSLAEVATWASARARLRGSREIA